MSTFKLLIIFFATMIVNFSTLYFVAWKLKKGTKILFKNPGFLIGDFILIPLYFVSIAILYSKDLEFIIKINLLEFCLIGVLAGLAILVSGIKFKLLKLIWLPHGIFGWLVIFSFLLAAITEASSGLRNFPIIVVSLILLIFHHLVGSTFPKKIE